MIATTNKLKANKKLARDYIDQVFNQHNPGKAADFLLTGDVVWHGRLARICLIKPRAQANAGSAPGEVNGRVGRKQPFRTGIRARAPGVIFLTAGLG